MKFRIVFAAATCLVLLCSLVSHAEIKVAVERQASDSASALFQFKNVPPASQNDAASKATFTFVDGRQDRNGGDLAVLHDGRLPNEEDQPAANFFFAAGSDGGRLLVNLGSAIDIKQVNTYSWHPGERGPQVYGLYAAEGYPGDWTALPQKGVDPAKCGWRLIAQVDTRPQQGDAGGQYGVSISDSAGIIGTYRYLLFDVCRTDSDSPFGQTFFSEIDVVDSTTVPVPVGTGQAGGEGRRETVEIEDGKYQIVIDTTETPDLADWATKELAPVVKEWYPKLVAMLPSDGYEAPTRVSITFSASMQGVAATGGTRVRCAATWFRRNLQGEAKGAIVHELVHVVQNYGIARRNNPNATRTPGWLVEGICDYIRWFLYEPQTHGADITSRNIANARYDASYRISGNFLNWAVGTYDKDVVVKLNAAAREGRYTEDLWKTITGHTVQELGDQWKASLEKEIAEAAKMNTLTEEEKAAGWKLLFNGESLDGWHNFRRQDIRPGWKVVNGVLICADPHDAGDLCTNEQFEWFELQLEYNVSPAGNSGIMYHVTDEARSAWATGPEFQLEDNAAAADPVRCGWLYALYQPPTDPATGKPLDATKPAGQWNQIRLLISPEKCEHVINGVKYFEYVLGSEDFQQRVAKSKFSRMPLFAKPSAGYIALQGDHGQVSFRNIKIRSIK